MSPRPLPPGLAREFSTAAARQHGISKKRLRQPDLEAPFRGVRISRKGEDPRLNKYDAARERELALIRALAARPDNGQFFCGRSAALIWGAPVPFRRDPELHLGVVKPRRAPKVRGVVGHTYAEGRVLLTDAKGMRLTSPASTFVTCGELPIDSLVALGDFLVRKYRPGVGRRHVGLPPLATIDELRQAVDLGRWGGMSNLRLALGLVREDAWSPQESWLRLALVTAGLPEPDLNVDVFDDSGVFLGCVDLVYRQFRVAIEYHGEQHSQTFAEDVERNERLRAAGWVVLQVTRSLRNRPEVLIERVAHALRARGWRG